LLRSNEAFRDLCGELAEAELALARVPESVASIGEQRKREWQELVDELAIEVEKSVKEI
jgi:hypothetical protein